jgi:neutral trehalase
MSQNPNQTAISEPTVEDLINKLATIQNKGEGIKDLISQNNEVFGTLGIFVNYVNKALEKVNVSIADIEQSNKNIINQLKKANEDQAINITEPIQQLEEQNKTKVNDLKNSINQMQTQLNKTIEATKTDVSGDDMNPKPANPVFGQPATVGGRRRKYRKTRGKKGKGKKGGFKYSVKKNKKKPKH